MRAFRLAFIYVLLIAFAALCPRPLGAQAGPEAPRPVVYTVVIDGVIDLGLAPLLERTLEEAAAADASAVILDINTLGGRLDAAILLRDILLASKVPTVAFVRRAISAGALISLAAGRIAMVQGGTIGAATPVQAGSPGSAPQEIGEKAVSYVRKEFRATAESRGRPPLLAEAMVDADVEIEGVIAKGKLLTLSASEAIEHKIADVRADDMDAVLAYLGLAGAEVRAISPNWAEQLVRFLTNPIVSSLLMTIGMLGLLLELRTPGFGVPGAIGLISLALFFWAHWLVRLVGVEELVLIGLGLVLLAVEAFVTPGFGITGVLGIIALLAGLTLSLLGGGLTWDGVLSALGQVAIAMFVTLLGFFALLRVLPQSGFGRHLILESSLPPGGGVDGELEGEPSGERRSLMPGQHGVTVSPLRPAGIALFGDDRVDVVSEGEFIEAGAPIATVRMDGNRIVVRRRGAASGAAEKEG